MKSPVTFRPVEPEDEEFLYRVYASTREEEMAATFWSDEEKETFLRMQFRAQSENYARQYPNADFLVILRDGQLAGRLYVDRKENEILIVDIALLPSHRGAGIGTTILQDLLQEARDAHKPVVVHVVRDNPARRLYERMGLRKIGEIGISYRMQWRANP